MPDFIFWYLFVQALFLVAIIAVIYIKVETLEKLDRRIRDEYLPQAWEDVKEATTIDDEEPIIEAEHDRDGDLDIEHLSEPWSTEPVIEDQRESTATS